MNKSTISKIKNLVNNDNMEKFKNEFNQKPKVRSYVFKKYFMQAHIKKSSGLNIFKAISRKLKKWWQSKSWSTKYKIMKFAIEYFKVDNSATDNSNNKKTQRLKIKQINSKSYSAEKYSNESIKSMIDLCVKINNSQIENSQPINSSIPNNQNSIIQTGEQKNPELNSSIPNNQNDKNDIMIIQDANLIDNNNLVQCKYDKNTNQLSFVMSDTTITVTLHRYRSEILGYLKQNNLYHEQEPKAIEIKVAPNRVQFIRNVYNAHQINQEDKPESNKENIKGYVNNRRGSIPSNNTSEIQINQEYKPESNKETSQNITNSNNQIKQSQIPTSKIIDNSKVNGDITIQSTQLFAMEDIKDDNGNIVCKRYTHYYDNARDNSSVSFIMSKVSNDGLDTVEVTLMTQQMTKYNIKYDELFHINGALMRITKDAQDQLHLQHVKQKTVAQTVLNLENNQDVYHLINKGELDQNVSIDLTLNGVDIKVKKNNEQAYELIQDKQVIRLKELHIKGIFVFTIKNKSYWLNQNANYIVESSVYMPKPELYQGSFGDCYILSALNAMSYNMEFMKQLNENCKYTMDENGIVAGITITVPELNDDIWESIAVDKIIKNKESDENNNTVTFTLSHEELSKNQKNLANTSPILKGLEYVLQKCIHLQRAQQKNNKKKNSKGNELAEGGYYNSIINIFANKQLYGLECSNERSLFEYLQDTKDEDLCVHKITSDSNENNTMALLKIAYKKHKGQEGAKYQAHNISQYSDEILTPNEIQNLGNSLYNDLNKNCKQDNNKPDYVYVSVVHDAKQKIFNDTNNIPKYHGISNHQKQMIINMILQSFHDGKTISSLYSLDFDGTIDEQLNFYMLEFASRNEIGMESDTENLTHEAIWSKLCAANIFKNLLTEEHITMIGKHAYSAKLSFDKVGNIQDITMYNPWNTSIPYYKIQLLEDDVNGNQQANAKMLIDFFAGVPTIAKYKYLNV